MYHLESRCLTPPMYWCITDQCEHWPSRCRSRSRKIGFLTEVSIHLRCHGILLTYRECLQTCGSSHPQQVPGGELIYWWWRKNHTRCHFSKGWHGWLPLSSRHGHGLRTCHVVRVVSQTVMVLVQVLNSSGTSSGWTILAITLAFLYQEVWFVRGKPLMFLGHSEIPHDFLRVWNQRDPLEWKVHEPRKKHRLTFHEILVVEIRDPYNGLNYNPHITG